MKRTWINGFFLVISNLAFGFPVGLEYKKHHMQHHRRVGHDNEVRATGPLIQRGCAHMLCALVGHCVAGRL